MIDPIQRRRALRAAFVGALLLCWASAGAQPFVATWRAARTPGDFTHDYVRAALWLRQGQWGRFPLIDLPRGNAGAASLGAPAVPTVGAFYVHPPPALLPFLPLGALPYATAVAIWQGVSVALLAFLAWLLSPLAAEAGIVLPAPLLFALLLGWPPTLANFQVGQWSVILAVALAAGHRAWERGQRRRAGICWGLAAALKLTPLALLPPALLRDRRAAVGFVAALLALVLLVLPVAGLEGWQAFAAAAGPNAAGYQTWTHNSLSINGLVARLLEGGAYARPLLVAPLLARGCKLAMLLALGAVALLATRRAPRTRDPEGCVLALWYVLVVVANPLAWSHYALLLLLPAGLALRAGAARHDAPAQALAALGVLLISIPQATLDYAAEPLPATPSAGLWLSLPLAGALLIFTSAARGARPAGTVVPPLTAPVPMA
jgi:hypothetical protein